MKHLLFVLSIVMLGACQTTNTTWHTVYDAGYGDNDYNPYTSTQTNNDDNDSSSSTSNVVENTQNTNFTSGSNNEENSSSPADPNSVPGPHNIHEAFEGPVIEQGTPDNPNPPVNEGCGLCN